MFSSPKSSKVDIPFALAAIRKIIKNSSIADEFKLFGHLNALSFFVLFTKISPINSPLYFFIFNFYVAFILFKICKIPVLVSLIFTSFINKEEFLASNVNTKKDEELISPGTL